MIITGDEIKELYNKLRNIEDHWANKMSLTANFDVKRQADKLCVETILFEKETKNVQSSR